MVDDAADWLKALPTHVQPTFNRKPKSSQSGSLLLTWTDGTRPPRIGPAHIQGESESVDLYATFMKNSARAIPVTDEAILRFAVIRGLRPEIRLHVLQSSPKDLEEVTKAAKVAETHLLRRSRPRRSPSSACKLQA